MKNRLVKIPVTPSLHLQDTQSNGQEVDLQAYLAPSHFGCMFAKLSEAQLSNLVIKLLSTICNVEIRWKSKIKRIHSPSLTPSTLYSMSHPLVQFAADSLKNVRSKSSISFQLRMNLVSLLLTSLSDVCLSNDLQALHDLLHKYKVLHKCTEMIEACKSKPQNSTVVGQTSIVHLTATLLRCFRMALEKYGNPRVIGDPKDSTRSKKEEIVKHICNWFSHYMAQILNAVLQPNHLHHCDEDLRRVIFNEIGFVMRLIGLCPLALKSSTSTSSSSLPVPKSETSYCYLKDARNALISVVRNILTSYPTIASHSPTSNQMILSCLKSSTCVHPYSVSSSVLKVLKVIKNRQEQDDLLNYLEMVYCHFYNKHVKSISRKWENVSDDDQTICPDSDSAFYASDSSLLIDHVQDQDILHSPSNITHSLEHWTCLRRCLLRKPHFKTVLLKHLESMIMKLNFQGRLDIFVSVVLPVIEKTVTVDDAGDNLEDHDWALKLARKLMGDKQVYKFLLDHVENFSDLVRNLISLNVSNKKDCDCSVDAFWCLKSLSVLELTLPIVQIRKISQEEGVGESEEDILPENEDFNVKLTERLSHGIAIPLILKYLESSTVTGASDTLSLWIIQRSLLLTNDVYAYYFVQGLVSLKS